MCYSHENCFSWKISLSKAQPKNVCNVCARFSTHCTFLYPICDDLFVSPCDLFVHVQRLIHLFRFSSGDACVVQGFSIGHGISLYLYLLLSERSCWLTVCRSFFPFSIVKWKRFGNVSAKSNETM